MGKLTRFSPGSWLSRVTAEFRSKTIGDYASFQIVNLLIGILAIPLLTRLLGSAEYGKYAVAMTWVAAVQTTVFYSTQLTVGRFCTEASSQRLSYPQSLIGLVLLLVGITFAATIGATFAGLSPLSYGEAAALSAVASLNGLFCINQEFLYVNGFSKSYRRAGNFLAVGRLSFAVIVLCAIQANLVAMLATWFGTQAMVLAALWKTQIRHLPTQLPMQRQVLTRIAIFGLPSALSHIFGGAMSWLPILYAGRFISLDAAAVLSIMITTLILCVTAIPSLLSFDKFPIALQAAQSGRPLDLRAMIHQQLKLLSLITVLASLAVLVAGPWFFGLLTGGELNFERGPMLLATISAGMVGAIRVLEPPFRIAFAQSLCAKILGFWACISLAIIVVFGSNFGLLGPLTAMFVSTVLASCTMYFFGKSRLIM